MSNYMSLKEYEDFNDAVEQEILCNEKYCPWWQSAMYAQRCGICEGRWCDEAWENYCDEHDKEYER